MPQNPYLAQKSREFISRQNTSDPAELLIRARRYADDETSTLTRQAARKVVAAFMAEVDSRIRSAPRRQASRPVTHVADFDDQFLYIE